MAHLLENELLAFVHIEKTAGTSLIHLLRSNYFFSYVDVRPLSLSQSRLFNKNDLVTYKKILPSLKCIGGHSVVSYSDLEDAANSVKYITILRNPVDRYLSQYQHWREKKKSEISFPEYLDIEALHNFQCKKIANTSNSLVAIKELEDRFALAGVLDHYDHFVQELALMLNSSYLPFAIEVRNKAFRRGKYDALREEYADDILERNSEDLKLYEYVLKKNDLKGSDQVYSQVTEKSKISAYKRNHKMRIYADYTLRKLYLNPVSSIIRLVNGLPMSGSY